MCNSSLASKSKTPDVLHHPTKQHLAQLVQGLIFSLTGKLELHQNISSCKSPTTKLTAERFLSRMGDCGPLEIIFSSKLIAIFCTV